MSRRISLSGYPAPTSPLCTFASSDRPGGSPDTVAREDLVIRIAGDAGAGELITGQMVTQATARAGYYVLTDSVPPAEIKGGYSFYQIRLGQNRLRSRGDSVDVLLAFNQEAFENSIEQLRSGGILIYDAAELNPPESDRY